MKNNQHTVRRTPDEWQKHFGIVVYDPDGWNRGASDWQAEWNRPLTESEFRARATLSTTGIGDKARYAYYWLRRRDVPRPEALTSSPEPEPIKPVVVKKPMCHKCAHGLFANQTSYMLARGARAQEYKGCGLDARISNYNDARFLCPLI